MRAREFIHETFDKPYEYTWDEYQNAHAITDQNRKLKISFSGGGGTYFMDFQVDGRALVTNKGDAYKIFATVLAATKDFMSKYDVKILIFSAKNDEQAGASRANLYDRMVQRYADAAGYTVTTQQDQIDDDAYKKYRLIRKENENMAENFADGKVKGKSRPGRVKRAGASCKGSVTDLKKRANKYKGEKGKMYQWCLNMKRGRKK